MRVIGGEFRSRKLKFPKTRDIRPATDRLKETIFDTLGGDLTGMRVLDLFAGMGSIAIEALSRGATQATLVDKNPVAIKYIYENLAALGIESRARVLKMDVLRAIPLLARRQGTEPVFNIIFIDPPYHQGLIKKTLLALEQFDILSPQTSLVIEHGKQEDLPPLKDYIVERTNRYGITCLSFLYRKG